MRVMSQISSPQTRHYMQSYEKLSVYMAYSANSLPLNLLRYRVVLCRFTILLGIFCLHFQLYNPQSPFKE